MNIPLPESCGVEALAEWLDAVVRESNAAGAWASATRLERARAVRALVEAKVREAVGECPVDKTIRDSIVSRVLGAP